MRRTFALAVVGAAAALLLPAAALPHAGLLATSPETQSSIASAPRILVLRFNEPVLVAPDAVKVLAEDGTVLSRDARASADGKVVIARVAGLRKGAAYTVRWRVTGQDGHSPTGLYTFGVGVPAPPPTEAVGAQGTTWRDDVARWLLFASLALVIGPLALRVLVLRGPLPARLERRFHLLTTVAAFAFLNLGILAFVLRASNALQVPVADLLYGDLQPFAEKTRFGVAFLVLTLGLGTVATLLLFAWVLDQLVLRVPALVLSLLLASGFSLSGHQATEPNASAAAQLADWLHLVAAAVWIGGLVTLAFVVWPVAPTLRARAFLGFARLSVGLVGVMVLAGVYLALVRLPTVTDLWETDYGRVLIVKLAIVTVALSWGAVHHFVVRPRLEAGEQPRVRPSLVGETAVALAVLLAAAVLTNATPPPPEDGPAAAPTVR